MALPKDPRQLMINLMYLVLTAMLALNITKEVLTAFQTINTSIEGSITSVDGKNAKFYEQFEKLYNNPDTKVKAEALRAKALLVKGKTEEMMKFLNTFKDTVISRSGGYEANSEGKQELKGLDNIDVATKLFVDEKKGDELRARMDGFKKFLIDQIDAPEVKEDMRKNLPIQIVDIEKSDENPTGDWSFGTFHNIPVIATIAMLSKFQNDVKNSESITVEHLLSQVGIDDWKFDEVKAIATPKTSYALEGQEIEATIILAAYNKTMVTNMGPGVVVKDGVGTLKFKATGVGQQTRKVSITVPKGGEMKTYTTEFNYMVGTAGASLQLDKMNVMYIGVPNPVSLSASGYNIEDVSLSLPGATLTATGKGHYSATVSKPGTINWTIVGKSRSGGGTANIGSGEIRVKTIPDPTAYVGGISSGIMNAGAFKVQQGVVALLKGFDFEAKFTVTSFKMIYLPRIGDISQADVQGNRFSNSREAQDIQQRSKPGDRVFFENIKAKGPDGTIRSLAPVSLTLN